MNHNGACPKSSVVVYESENCWPSVPWTGSPFGSCYPARRPRLTTEGRRDHELGGAPMGAANSDECAAAAAEQGASVTGKDLLFPSSLLSSPVPIPIFSFLCLPDIGLFLRYSRRVMTCSTSTISRPRSISSTTLAIRRRMLGMRFTLMGTCKNT